MQAQRLIVERAIESGHAAAGHDDGSDDGASERSCPNPQNGMREFVRHSLHSFIGETGERCEARISLGLMVPRDTINGTVDLLMQEA
jgi:hypothetical protein